MGSPSTQPLCDKRLLHFFEADASTVEFISATPYCYRPQIYEKHYPRHVSLDHALRDKTATLLQAAPDDPVALEQLRPLLYEELRQIAHRQLRRERQNHTLQTTALVHEAYLPLV